MVIERALEHGGHAVAAEKRNATAHPYGHDRAAAMEGMAMTPTGTLAQIVAMTGLTVLALGAGILVATIGGRWTM